MKPLKFRPHPWHGLSPGPQFPEILYAYVELTPTDGVNMVERSEADDKIIAVLIGDPTYGDIVDVSHLPRAVIDRLRHYFLTHKTIPGESGPTITVDPVYNAMEARAVLNAARADYIAKFTDIEFVANSMEDLNQT